MFGNKVEEGKLIEYLNSTGRIKRIKIIPKHTNIDVKFIFLINILHFSIMQINDITKLISITLLNIDEGVSLTSSPLYFTNIYLLFFVYNSTFRSLIKFSNSIIVSCSF